MESIASAQVAATRWLKGGLYSARTAHWSCCTHRPQQGGFQWSTVSLVLSSLASTVMQDASSELWLERNWWPQEWSSRGVISGVVSRDPPNGLLWSWSHHPVPESNLSSCQHVGSNYSTKKLRNNVRTINMKSFLFKSNSSISSSHCHEVGNFNIKRLREEEKIDFEVKNTKLEDH